MRHIIKILFFILTTLFLVEDMYAQAKSGNVTVNIIFHPIQTIAINSSQKSIDLSYVDIEDYRTGVSATLDDHLTVTSVGGFQVNVASQQENFTNAGDTDFIPVSDLSIRAMNGSGNDLSNEYDNVVLSTNPEALIKSEVGGLNLKYNVTYDNTAGGSEKYINKTSGDNETTYSTEITYTITSK